MTETVTVTVTVTVTGIGIGIGIGIRTVGAELAREGALEGTKSFADKPRPHKETPIHPKAPTSSEKFGVHRTT